MMTISKQSKQYLHPRGIPRITTHLLMYWRLIDPHQSYDKRHEWTGYISLDRAHEVLPEEQEHIRPDFE